jgi:putative transcriptional regulator
MEVVTNCVNELRTKARQTQEELASALGVTRQTIISIEKGNYTPSVLLALKIANHFAVTVEQVFSICTKK